MRLKPEVIADMLERIATEGRRLTDWEREFVESVTDQFERRGSLTDKQVDVIERIYTEKVP